MFRAMGREADAFREQLSRRYGKSKAKETDKPQPVTMTQREEELASSTA